MAKLHSLVWLDYDLKRVGISGRCYRYELSAAHDCLHIAYLDKMLNEQFISVFRTSRLAYRIYYNGELLTARTAAAAAKLLDGILTKLITDNEYYSVMTVAEFLQFNRAPNKSVELYTRLKKTVSHISSVIELSRCVKAVFCE
jgi:isocitrate lyase